MFAFSIGKQQRLPKELQWLCGKKPKQSLQQTAHYFLDLLSPDEYNKLQQVCGTLSQAGRPILVGTTCSGLETGGMAIEKLFDALNERFGTQLSARVAFAAELHEDWVNNIPNLGTVDFHPNANDIYIYTYIYIYQLLFLNSIYNCIYIDIDR